MSHVKSKSFETLFSNIAIKQGQIMSMYKRKFINFVVENFNEIVLLSFLVDCYGIINTYIDA